jgi:hypothetical protein
MVLPSLPWIRNIVEIHGADRRDWALALKVRGRSMDGFAQMDHFVALVEQEGASRLGKS